jgi:hypothetical protein
MKVEEAVTPWCSEGTIEFKEGTIGFKEPSGIRFNYTNYKGETEDRHVRPISMRFGTSLWHTEPQWLVKAWDFDRKQYREFALADMRLLPSSV